jgi:hypothetical protein
LSSGKARSKPSRLFIAATAGASSSPSGPESTARETVGPFLEAWCFARETQVDVRTTFEDWIASKKLPSRNEKDGEHLFDMLVDAWQIEPGKTLADAVNAVTRAAHRSDGTHRVQQELERRATRLVAIA